MSLRSLVRAPLLHFFLIGLGLFFLYGRVSPGDSESRRIVVSQSQVDDLVRQYGATWNRSPTPSELSGLVDAFVRDEIIYREGLSMGLDRDDAVIKRRIRQKYDLIAEEEGARLAPIDADLKAYLKAKPGKFVRPAIVSFEQIYFEPASSSPEAVSAVKASLAARADPTAFGQPSILPRNLKNVSLDLVARDFGDNFASAVGVAPVGRWVGPMASGLGVHLVRVSARSAPILPPLDEVRSAVTREWESDRRTRAREAEYRKLRDEYDVVVEAKQPLAPKP